MAIRSVVQVGDDVLRQKCFPVEEFDEKLWALLDDMKETVKKEQGAGLAAPQVGVLRRLAVVDVEEGYFELINPVIVQPRRLKSSTRSLMRHRKFWITASSLTQRRLFT